MSKNEHKLGVFVNHSTRQFSLTARKASYPLWDNIEIVEAEKGFGLTILAEKLKKTAADDMKAVVKAAYVLIGYSEVSRLQMSDSAVPNIVKNFYSSSCTGLNPHHCKFQVYVDDQDRCLHIRSTTF